MAENNNDNKQDESPGAFNDIIVVAVLVFLGFSLLTQAPDLLRNRFGIDIENPETIYQRTPVTDGAHVGAMVVNAREASVYDSPGGTLIGSHDEDATGRITAGPSEAAGVTWWEVDYEADPDGWVRQSALLHNPLFAGIGGVLSFLQTIATIISLLLLAGVIYNTVRISQIRSEEQEALERMTRRALRSAGGKENNRWRHIIQHIESANENDWRTAILEADIMLDDMMETMGYHQDTLGDKLKEVEESDFTTLDKAWEAHKARNKIAHEGKEYALTQREAQRIIGLYEEVFREFRYI